MDFSLCASFPIICFAIFGLAPAITLAAKAIIERKRDRQEQDRKLDKPEVIAIYLISLILACFLLYALLLKDWYAM